MQTSPKLLLVLPVVFSIATAACTGGGTTTTFTTGASENVSSPAPPAGCERTWCDVEADRCKASERDYCSECFDKCADTISLNPDFTVSCVETCNGICQRSATSDACGDSLRLCRSSKKNTVCADDIPAVDLPDSSKQVYLDWKPPASPHAGVCTDAAIQSLIDSCIDSASEEVCDAAINRHLYCARCMFSVESAPAWGPFVITEYTGRLVGNDWGCIAEIEGDDECAQVLMNYDNCLQACAGAKDLESCKALANEHTCSMYWNSKTAECEARVQDPRFAVCSRNAKRFDDTVPLVRFFCGSP